MTRSLLPVRNLWFNVTLVIIVVAAETYSTSRGRRWGDWLAIAFFAYYTAYCTLNLARCGEIHCAVTAPGFAGAAVLMLLQVLGIAHYGFGLPWIAFAVSACSGYCLQSLYRKHTGSIYLKR